MMDPMGAQCMTAPPAARRRSPRESSTWRRTAPPRTAARGAGRVISDRHFRKTATECYRKTGIKWLSCTEKVTIGYNPTAGPLRRACLSPLPSLSRACLSPLSRRVPLDSSGALRAECATRGEAGRGEAVNRSGSTAGGCAAPRRREHERADRAERHELPRPREPPFCMVKQGLVTFCNSK